MPKIKILIVEDNEEILNNFKMFFSDEGFEVKGINTGKTAIELVRSKPFDLGIIDMRMPKMNGDVLIEKLAVINSKMHFFIHTGSEEFILTDKLKEYKMTSKDIFRKPVSDMQIFIKRIKEVFS